jgi:type I restriction enzyme S subunit
MGQAVRAPEEALNREYFVTIMDGYKKTDIGVIPADWAIVAIGDLITDFKGGAPLKPSDFRTSGIKVLPKGAVDRTGWLNLKDSDTQCCSPAYALIYRRNQVDRTFTIVVLRDLVPSGPNIGLMVRIRDDDTFLLAQGVYGFRPNSRAISEYLVHLSNTNWYRKVANSIMVGSTQVHITNTAFRRILVPLPNHTEQQSIAEALSDADTLIESLEKLLEKKRYLKHAAMQELLTGKKRLPGFSGEWELQQLRESCLKIQDGTHFSPKMGGNDFHYVTSRNVGFGVLDVSSAERISASEHNKIYARCDVRYGDLLLTKDGANTGNAALNTINEPFSLLSSVALLRFDGRYHVPAFFLYHILSQHGQQQIKQLMSGNAITRLTLVKIRSLQFPVPSVKEQAAIASILSDVDVEINALEMKLIKAREIKKGMMQELLTGRIRLA